MLIGLKEWILQQPHVCRLHCLEHRLQLHIPESWPGLRAGRDAAPPHVHDAHHLYARVGFEAVGRESVVEGLEEARLAGQIGAGGEGGGLGAEVKNVDRGGEEEGELERGADRGEGVC